MAKLKCSVCGKEESAESVFVYNDKNYCSCHYFDLIYEMVEDGNVTLNHDDMEEKGVRINF